MRYLFLFIFSLFLVGISTAEQLEPRAYWPAPVGINVTGVSYFYSTGDAVFDPSLPIKNVHANIHLAVPFYGRTFGLFGRQSSFVIGAPYVKGTVTGDVFESNKEANREGPGDPLFRFSYNITGSPALKPFDFFKRKPSTILGTSLSVIAPFGQYDSSKLINIGSHRWSVKPEIGLLQPVGNWELEVFAGVWLFTDNNNFFGGKKKKQAPLYSTQAHIIRELGTWGWTALDFTYYAGGETTVNGKLNDDRQDNTRTGLTYALPLTKKQWLKFGWSRGVSTRIGSKFTSYGATWQYMWF